MLQRKKPFLPSETVGVEPSFLVLQLSNVFMIASSKFWGMETECLEGYLYFYLFGGGISVLAL